MTHLQSARLENLFGAALDAVNVGDVRALVENNVAEAFDLDFKRDRYGNSDSERRSLASDVAALANTAGGVIVLGVDEDANARASSAPGVEVNDAEVARITQIVASLVSPLPPFDVVPVVGGVDDPSYILIAVARSALAPHAVLVNNETLRYPTRKGTTTRYLAEPEVAAAYRERTTSTADRVRRATDAERNIGARLDPKNLWLVVTCVPEISGDLRIDQQTYSEFERTVRDKSIHPVAGGGAQFHRVGVAFESFVASGSYQENDEYDWGISTALYTDGVGVVASQLWNIRNGIQPPDPSQTISDEALAATLIGSLQFLGLHARDRAHAGGTSAVRAFIVPSAEATQTFLGHSRSMGFPSSFGRPITKTTPVATSYALIDGLADGGPDVVSAAHQLHVRLGHAFGSAELPQLTDDGRFRWGYWNHDYRPAVKLWADRNGVEIDGFTS